MNNRILLIIVCLFLIQQMIKSQTTDDFGIWSTIGVEKSIGKKWEINGELEFRGRENMNEVGRWAIKIGGDYKIIKNIKLGVAYQFQYFNDLEYTDFQPRHRLIGSMQGKQKWKRFTFSLRERVQGTYKDDSDRIKSSGKIDTYKMDPEWTWKNRLKVSYDIPKCKFTPSASIETFYQLNNPDGNEFDALRYTLSLAYKIDKKNKLNLSGIYDHEMNVKEPTDKYIMELGYVYSF
ncbi:DUF2490 domain-containing protein [Massilibacteroides sp.]|uniref:DUF2490 domain-containing protein n=1 Tax=Massilibacteroides sp. TaxID=2034766 RepID=UPI00261DD207|nr:DUF2490 domain-containing protein [Massilibacteroides sp.]MDD4514849.1 DUF2490 domain-containing protein [Massilibacteroides sp.]